MYKTWMALTTLILGLAILGTSAWAAPYLQRGIEDSKARSQRECENFARKAIFNVARSGPMQVYPKNNQIGYTKHTTILVDCIFVGQNKWIYYISAASTDANDVQQIRSSVHSAVRKIVPTD